MENARDIVIIGGGAAGIFSAIEAKRAHPDASVLVLEKSAVLLSKVRISGGGRCNTTHACFDPMLLSKNYPRGGKELIGPFHRFGPRDTVEWFQARGVRLKTESDGRMFPTTDSSETIIHCLLDEAKKLGVVIALRQKVEQIEKTAEGFLIKLSDRTFLARSLLLATGSSPQGYEWARQLGHTIQLPIPSLFTFNVPSSPLRDLSGLSLIAELILRPPNLCEFGAARKLSRFSCFSEGSIEYIQPSEKQLNPEALARSKFTQIGWSQYKISGTSFSQTGPLLLTHFGFSGPAAIKLSAWAARQLYAADYRVDLILNWLPKHSLEDIYEALLALKSSSPNRFLSNENLFNLPKNLWKRFTVEIKMKDISHKDLRKLADKLHADHYQVEGKTTNKEEFVTCGGVNLSEVNFQTMESKICSGLFFAGEILDIDGVTGGFNFQSAWTTGFIAGQSV